MCIVCHMPDPPTWHFRYYIGGWKNITYRGRRGEGHPAPWIMFRIGRFGFSADMQRFRKYLKPEIGVAKYRPINPYYIFWGNFAFTWMPKERR